MLGNRVDVAEAALERERQILAVMGAGTRTIPEMVKVIYKDVPEALHLMAGQSVHSHLKIGRASCRERVYSNV